MPKPNVVNQMLGLTFGGGSSILHPKLVWPALSRASSKNMGTSHANIDAEAIAKLRKQIKEKQQQCLGQPRASVVLEMVGAMLTQQGKKRTCHEHLSS